MNETSLTLSSSHNLLPFILLSKSVKGAAHAKLIMDTLDAPGVYVFSELYESPNVVQASTLPEVKPYYALLELFLYGTYGEYTAHASQLPALTPKQLIKLKHLSIVTLSEKRRTLNYQDLLTYLDIPSIRELEDLIIDAIYQGVLTGKLDQRRQELQVNTTMGRDLRPGQLDDLVGRVTAWADQTASLTNHLQQTAQSVMNQVQANESVKAQYTKDIEQVRQALQIKSKQVIDTDPKKDGPARQNEFYEAERAGGRAKKRQVMEK
ncbi:hypothetical protein BC941DRAFT_417987 [Chlamydoabsidia padenii]|nr:hypothetical protein BC941DRAFT_417987 [Chlamydoabsidia padenii]